jgi:hypothetical protein
VFWNRLIVALAIIAIAAVGGVALQSRGLAHGPSAPRSTFTSSQAKLFKEFALYNAGNDVAGLPLVAILRRNDPPTNWVSFIYGDCTPTGGAGCAPPAEVQIWPACRRNPAIFAKSVGAPRAESTISIRGVPAAFYEEGTRLEIQTGRSTVVIFGESRELISQVAAALRGVNRLVTASDRLPPPAPGAVDGKLPCA